MPSKFHSCAVFVHGLWMPGRSMTLLRRRVQDCGFRTVQFTCSTVQASARENAERLRREIAAIDAEQLHFVGHSLGGLVIRWLFHDHPDQRPGRIVTLGTPHNGSRIARRVSGWSLGRQLLGRSLDQALLGGLPPWRGAHELGVIAGTLPIGVGVLEPGLLRPHDGTVAVEETRLDGMRDFVEVNASHLGLLFSAEAARQTCSFLREGHFLPVA